MIDVKVLEFLERLAVAAHSEEVLRPQGEPGHVYYLQHTDGVRIRYEATPFPRDHVVCDINSLVDSFRLLEPAESGHNLSVWYDRDEVVVLLDDATRRDKVTLPVGLSPQIISLRNLEGKSGRMSQRDLLRFLRVDMFNCLGAAGDLIACVRTIKFTANASGESSVQTTKRSVGNQIESQMSGAGTLPEYVDFQVPLFENPNLPHIGRVMVAVDVDPATQTFQLTPVPQAIDQALRGGEDQLGKDINERIAAVDSVTESDGGPGTSIKVFYGKHKDCS